MAESVTVESHIRLHGMTGCDVYVDSKLGKHASLCMCGAGMIHSLITLRKSFGSIFGSSPPLLASPPGPEAPPLSSARFVISSSERRGRWCVSFTLSTRCSFSCHHHLKSIDVVHVAGMPVSKTAGMGETAPSDFTHTLHAVLCLHIAINPNR